MTWITTVDEVDATGRLKKLYDLIRAPNGQIDNIMRAHSLRPHTMDGHMALYKNVLHHSANKLPRWFLETIGIYVSLLNGCAYCVEHHYAGLQQLLDDRDRATAIREALDADEPSRVFNGAQYAALAYARALTLDPDSAQACMIEDMRAAGLEDGQILEVNQVAAYFAYANRTVLGLGIDTQGEVLGLAPKDSGDPGNWTHT